METLATLVERDGPLAARDAVGWAIRLAKRVEELHRLGVAHGGVSAYCVLTGGKPFTSKGLLGDVRDAATRPAYHSPERHAGQGISVSDDTWGLVVLLYYLMTGSMPFAGVTTPEIRQRIQSVDAAPLAVFDVGDDSLQRVLNSFLAKDITRRHTKVKDLREALESWHGGPGAMNVAPLEDEDDDSIGEFDDDEEENIATVMRDFSEVRAQLEMLKLQQDKKAKAAPPQTRPPGARPIKPTAIGGFGTPPARPLAESVSEVRGAPFAGSPGARPNARAPIRSAPAPPSQPMAPAPSAPGHLRGMPPPRGSGPRAAYDSNISYPGMSPQRESGTGIAPPRGSGAGLDPPSPDFGIDDTESDENVATVMLGEGSDLASAIEEALASQRGSTGPPGAGPPGAAPPGWPSQPAAPSGLGHLTGPPAGVAGTLALDGANAVPPHAAAPQAAPPQGAPPPYVATPQAGQQPPLGVVPGTSLGAPVGTTAIPPTSSSRGLRIALIIASIILVLVVTAVVLLYLDRQGTINLGIKI